MLKKQQIETRQKLLEEYQIKLWKKQKRYDIAKDVPRIDGALSAETDVLEQKYRINTLNGLIEKNLYLLKMLIFPANTPIEFKGDLPSFEYSLDDVVRVCKENSFHIGYLKAELKQKEHEFDQLAWDYKPQFSGKAAVEDRRQSSVSRSTTRTRPTASTSACRNTPTAAGGRKQQQQRHLVPSRRVS